MLVGVTMRETDAPNYDEKRDALAHDWTHYLCSLGFIPVPIPNGLTDIASYLKLTRIKALILTGGNAVPTGSPSSADESPARDQTEAELIKIAVTERLPLFGVCRGLQIINAYFGGSITRNFSEELAITTPHVAATHPVDLHNRRWKALAGKDTIDVNSYHDDIVLADGIAPELTITATSDEGKIVEGLASRSHLIAAVQWHPERTDPAKAFNAALLRDLLGVP